jgi:serine/threonine-protein kinase RsbW
MSEESWSWQIERQLPSEIAAGEEIIREVVRQLNGHGWPERDVFGIHMALEEGLINAIRHGNKLDRTKHVRFICQLSDRRLRMEISDEGPGFDPNRVPDCTADENLERPCGRGIMLMRHYMTRVDYTPSGNCVVMEKDRD